MYEIGYRQYVKGSIKVDGKVRPFPTSPDVNPDRFVEDHSYAVYYGHRENWPTIDDRYTPRQATGRIYDMSDEPGTNAYNKFYAATGADYKVEAELHFLRRMVDLRTDIITHTWTVLAELKLDIKETVTIRQLIIGFLGPVLMHFNLLQNLRRWHSLLYKRTALLAFVWILVILCWSVLLLRRLSGMGYLHHSFTFVSINGGPPEEITWTDFSPIRFGLGKPGLSIPDWCIAQVLLFLPFIAKASYSFSLRVKRNSLGKCRNCRYDMRATPSRCPACGMLRGRGKSRAS